MRQVEPYKELAAIYDRVMDHVDYREWAGYVDGLLSLHAPGAHRILEFGAGTGRFAEQLSMLREMNLTLTDRSREMLDRAELRLQRAGIAADFVRLDFTDPPGGREMPPGGVFDAVLLLYDGFNYAVSKEQAVQVLDQATFYLRPGGIFIFDHVTPANSTNERNVFEDEGSEGDISFFRTSEFDAERCIHRTTFDIRTPGGSFFEEHVQRIWTPDEVDEIAAEGPLDDVASWDGYTYRPATDDSERIHRVMSRPG